MNAPSGETDRANRIIETCLEAIAGGVPGSDEDWIESGLLDSMGHVEVLTSIERAAGIPGAFNRVSPLPVTVRAASEILRRALAERTRAGTATEETSRGGAADQDRHAYLAGWGMALGSQRVAIGQVEAEFGLEPGYLAQRTGIVEVRRISADEDEVTLGQNAARQALERAGESPDDLAWILASTGTYHQLPALAASLHAALLAPTGCRVLDVGGECAGLPNALAVAQGLLGAGGGRSVLIVTADAPSRILSPGRAPGKFGGLFGDGASAFVLRGHRTDEQIENPRILASVGGCAGSFAAALKLAIRADGSLDLVFDGETLARAALERMQFVLDELEAASGIGREAARAFVLHQPNPRLVDTLLRQAGLPAEKVPLVAKSAGNLVASTCGVALCLALEAQAGAHPHERGPIFIAALGPGLIWAGAILG